MSLMAMQEVGDNAARGDAGKIGGELRFCGDVRRFTSCHIAPPLELARSNES